MINFIKAVVTLAIALIPQSDVHAFGGIANWTMRAPSGLSYGANPATYTKWTSITNNSPTVRGLVSSYSVSPALPAGLTLNTTTGVISGTPSAHDETGADYTITVTGPGGSSTLLVNIKVMIPNYTWLGTAGDNNWATGANWKGASAPGAAHTAIFDDSCSGLNCNASIGASITLTGIDLKSNYPGTLTQSGANTINLGTNWIWSRAGFRIAGGNFVGGSGNIRADILTITGGTFTSTTGELRLGYDCDYSNTTDGMTLGASGAFAHNGGSVYIVASGGSNYGTTFQITANQIITFNSLSANIDDRLASGSYNTRYVAIDGTTKTIVVNGELNFYDGYVHGGTIDFYGPEVRYYCDAPGTQRYCARIAGGLGSVSGYNRLNFKGIAAQTYTYQAGASAGSVFGIQNGSGVSTAGTTDFALYGVEAQIGNFTAPAGATLAFGRGTDASWYGSAHGLILSGTGDFTHNGGTVSFEYTTQYNDGRLLGNLSSSVAAPLVLNNFVMDIRADSANGNLGRDAAYVGISSGMTIIINGNYTFKDGGFGPPWSSTTKFVIRGNYVRECASVVNDVCANREDWVTKEFDTAGSSISVAAGAEDEWHARYIFSAPGTVTINNAFRVHTGTLDPQDWSSLTVNAGTTLVLANGAIVSAVNRIINNGVVTCTGTGYIQHNRGVTGTPQGGNQPACYGL